MIIIQRRASGYMVESVDGQYESPSSVGALHWALTNGPADEKFEIGATVRRDLCEALREMLCGAEAERADEKPPSRESVVSYLKAQRDMEVDRWERFIEVVERGE